MEEKTIKTDQSGLITNMEGKLSGTKICFLFTHLSVTVIMMGFLIRDFWFNKDLTMYHLYICFGLLVLALINRMSSRSIEKKVLDLDEFSIGPTGVNVGFSKEDKKSSKDEEDDFIPGPRYSNEDHFGR
jgi:hypothetical protein